MDKSISRISKTQAPRDRGGSTETPAAALLGMFMVILDAVIVNVALPSIGHDLGGGISGLQWVVDGYTLLFAALLLSAGSISDRIGARSAFLIGLGIFTVASALCGLAPTMDFLVGARVIQGGAAAVIMPASMALVRGAFDEPARRARAVAVWAMGGAAAASSGPVLGGLLTIASWRLIFFINIPVGLCAALLVLRAQPSTRRGARFDWLGQIAAVVAMGTLTYGAIEAGGSGFGSPAVVAAFVIAVLAVAAFVFIESKVPHPMLPLGLVRSRNVAVSSAVGFAFMVGYYGLPFVMSLYLQVQRGFSPLMTGIAFLPMMLSGAILTPFSARIAERHGRTVLITTGLVTMGVGLAVLAIVTPSITTLAVALLMILVGLAGPTVMPAITAVLLDSVCAERVGTASGVFNTSRQIGGALAVAVFGALLAAPGHFESGMRTSLLIAAVVALGAAGATRLMRQIPAREIPVEDTLSYATV